MTCHEVVTLVTEYLEDALSPQDRRRFEEHLSGCDGCRNYLDQIRRTIALTGMLKEEQIPEEHKQALLTAFRTWTR